MPTKMIDLAGQAFGRLTVLSYRGSIRRKPSWLCLCECGKECVIRGDMLKCGNSRSCGCLKIESATKHGRSHTNKKPHDRTYISWQGMWARCTNPASSRYAAYGGAGISVCDRWKSFEDFLADMGDRPAGKTLDRIDNAKGYSPENCRWATPAEQARNRRCNRMLTVGDQTRCVGEWAEIRGIPRVVIQDRLRLGWNDADAVNKPYAARAKS